MCLSQSYFSLRHKIVLLLLLKTMVITYKNENSDFRKHLREMSVSLETVAHKKLTMSFFPLGKILDLPLWLPLGFHSLQRCRAGICRYGPWAKSRMPPASINKVSSEQSTSLHLLIVTGCFPTLKAELSSYSGPRGPQHLKNFSFGPLQSLPNPDVG